MKKYIPAAVVALVFIGALILTGQTHKKNEQQASEKICLLEGQLTALQAQLDRQQNAPEITVADIPVEEAPAIQSLDETAVAEDQETAGRRMMSSMAKMMDNPTMNKVMEASQRGAIGALYSDFIDYLNLNPEEATYFMDLLMQRQMKNVEFGMKMMSGGASEEEQAEMKEAIKLAGEALSEEMENFLNNPDDFAEWEFYEETMGERMMLSQMDQQLAGSDAMLSNEAYKELLGVMHDERENYNFSSDLHDDENMDLSPARFSKENIDAHANDVRSLNAQIIARAESILTPAQFAAFQESLKTSTEMQLAQLDMAAQMFGGGSE